MIHMDVKRSNDILKMMAVEDLLPPREKSFVTGLTPVRHCHQLRTATGVVSTQRQGFLKLKRKHSFDQQHQTYSVPST